MRIKLELDPETTEKLVEAAVREKRPAAWQAEVLLRTALGLPFPPPILNQPTPPQPPIKTIQAAATETDTQRIPQPKPPHNPSTALTASIS
jgi:hypothetical protein